MQVLYAENHFFKTINIHWKTENEFLKDTSSRKMIYTQ